VKSILRIPSFLFAVLAVAPLCYGFGDAGHESVVAIALQIDPALRDRVNAILKDLPDSSQWKSLEASNVDPHVKHTHLKKTIRMAGSKRW